MKMTINKENIEILLFDYAEGDLTEKECQEVEKFLDTHEQYKQMLQAYQQSEKLERPKNIIYDEKDDLFTLATSQNKPKIILISKYIKWISAAAAIILLIVSIKPFYQNPNQPINEENFISQKTDSIMKKNDNLIAKNKTAFHEIKVKKEFTNHEKEFTETPSYFEDTIKYANTIENQYTKQEEITTSSTNLLTQEQEKKTAKEELQNFYPLQYKSSQQELAYNETKQDTIYIIRIPHKKQSTKEVFVNYVNQKKDKFVDKIKEKILYNF